MNVTGVVVLVLTVVNFIIYHKIFTVWYIGSISQSIFKELLWSMIIAGFETVLLIHFAGFIIHILIVIVAIVAALIAICAFVGELGNIKKYFSEHFPKKESTEEKNQAATQSRNTASKEKGFGTTEKNEEEKTTEAVKMQPVESVFCTTCGNKISVRAKFCPKCGMENWYLKNMQRTENDAEKAPVCLQCGKQLLPTDKFCTACGAARGENKKQTEGGD